MVRIPKIGDLYRVIEQTVDCGKSVLTFGEYSQGSYFECVGSAYFAFKQDLYYFDGWWVLSKPISNGFVGFYPLNTVELESESSLDLENIECTCDNTTLMREGCICGSISRYKS